MTDKEKSITEGLVNGMTSEELDVVIKCIPDSFLWNELLARYNTNKDAVRKVKKFIGEMTDEASKGVN